MQMHDTAEVIQVVGDTHANERMGRKLELGFLAPRATSATRP